MDVTELCYFCGQSFNEDVVMKNRQALETVEDKNNTAFLHQSCLLQSMGKKINKRWIFPVIDETLD
jgi:hypothetical protein